MRTIAVIGPKREFDQWVYLQRNTRWAGKATTMNRFSDITVGDTRFLHCQTPDDIYGRVFDAIEAVGSWREYLEIYQLTLLRVRPL